MALRIWHFFLALFVSFSLCLDASMIIKCDEKKERWAMEKGWHPNMIINVMQKNKKRFCYCRCRHRRRRRKKMLCNPLNEVNVVFNRITFPFTFMISKLRRMWSSISAIRLAFSWLFNLFDIIATKSVFFFITRKSNIVVCNQILLSRS